MPISESNHIQTLNSYTLQDWKPLLDLIPIIEQTESFGEVRIKQEADEELCIIMENWDSADIVYKFLDIVYDIPIVIDFDWSHWDEGRKMASDENFDFDTIDIPTKCKLITAFVRNDRFCDGALSGAFQRGTILKILKSIQKQLQER